MAIFVDTKGANQGILFACGRRQNVSDWRTKGVSVTAENGALKVNTPYSSAFVEELKLTIPATSRKWDPNSKSWLVSRDYTAKLKEIIDRAYDCDVVMPTVIADPAQLFTTTFQADYVANCKNEAASVHSNGGWNAKIPEKVLRAWFKQVDTSGPATLYGVLGLDKTATDQEIKKAYKRAARQWHPDVCREENAREMFESVKNAYNILSSQLGRNKYDAGLAFEAMARSGHQRGAFHTKYSTFTPTLRCGRLTVKARRDLGVLIVEEILAWEDIENEIGQIMVSFWAGDSWSMAWV
jgi:DnaJ-like protein